MLKYLRIAVTAFSVTACVVLIALWVSSYVWHLTAWCGTRHTGVTVQSRCGECQLGIESNQDEYVLPNIGIRFTPVSGEFSNNADFRELKWGGFWATLDIPDDYYPGVRHSFIGCRHWLLAMVFGTLAALPWFKWRFSLRTLLITITLVAVGLGAIAALS